MTSQILSEPLRVRSTERKSAEFRLGKTFVTLSVFLATAMVATAQALVSWETTGALGSEASLPATFAETNLSGLSLTRGAGLSTGSAANNFGASGFTGEATDYISFGFNVSAGYSVDLTQLSFATRSSGTGPGTMGLFYSVDGFSTPLATIQQSPGANYVNSLIPLSLAGLTGSVEFRLMPIGTNSANGGSTASGGTFRVGDYFDAGTSTYSPITFSGAVSAVPEPGTVALVGLGLGAVLYGTRRKRS